MSAASARVVSLTISRPLARDDLPGLEQRARALLGSGETRVLRCDLAGLPADAVAVDALARLKLVASRSSCQMEISGACPQLTALIDFIGLADVLSE
jgi:ABC-type transporter Mla MlaB component